MRHADLGWAEMEWSKDKVEFRLSSRDRFTEEDCAAISKVDGVDSDSWYGHYTRSIYFGMLFDAEETKKIVESTLRGLWHEGPVVG